jgi:hypothetical protein
VLPKMLQDIFAARNPVPSPIGRGLG